MSQDSKQNKSSGFVRLICCCAPDETPGHVQDPPKAPPDDGNTQDLDQDPPSPAANIQDWQDKLALIEHLASGGDLDEEMAEDIIGCALDMLQGLLQLTQPNDTTEVDIPSLKLPPRTAAEDLLAKYSWLGAAAVGLASQAISALPFGAPVAAVLTCLYGHADQAAKNSKNCKRLLVLVQECHLQMKKLAEAKERRLPAEAPRHVRRLGVLLVRSGHTMKCYIDRHFIVRLITSSGDMTTFQLLETGIRDSMQSLSLVVAVEVLTSTNFADESKGLRAAVCKAAGLDEQCTDEARTQALLELRKEQPDLLRKLLNDHGNFGNQVVEQAMDVLAEQIRDLQAEVREVKSRLEQLEDKMTSLAACGPAYMADWLLEWWEGAIGKYELEVEDTAFVKALIAWFAEKGQEEELLEYDRHLAEKWLQAKLEVVGEHPFLWHIVLPLLDADHDNMVTRPELMKLEVMSREFATTQCYTDPPTSMPTMLKAVYTGSVGPILAQRRKMRQGIKGALDMISAALQVQDMIRTYGIANLLDEYHRGSREWMYERVDAWLKVALDSASEASRLFLLLAEAGMGKSVFSAVMETKLMVRAIQNSTLVVVRHFFKVGQPRAQGKAAVLCLAQQLSENLPGFAKLLLPVVERHGNASALSMLEAFESFLLGPLQALDTVLTPGSPRHCVLIVLDAMDEADDGGSGWQPVTNMIAVEFRSLPQWTKVLLTGRPQIEPTFKAWKPVWIKPEHGQNKEDLCELLNWRLRQVKCVDDQDIDAAAQLLLAKSGGQFIYSKYVFEELADQATWTLDELERLPDGLQGMFRHVMDTLCDALQQEALDMHDLLLHRLLPVLVAVREPLTVKELTWAVTSDLAEHDEAGRERVGKQVSRLVGLLAPLFPLRMEGSDGEPRIVPYHKSVLDWLDPASSDGDGGSEQASSSARALHPHAYSMDAAVGHRLLGQAAYQRLLPTFNQALEASSHQRSCKLHQLCNEEMPSLLLLGGRYALHHAVAHLCQAAAVRNNALRRILPLLHALLLHPGFWQQAFGAGLGPDVAQDLIMLGPAVPEGPGRSVINDVIRWLSGNAATLALYPRAALQFAVDAPRATTVAEAASKLSYRPPARLLTKEDDWSPLVTTCSGHTDRVTQVAISFDNKTIVSGSRDRTARVWDVETGLQKGVLEDTGAVVSVAVSSDGKTTAFGLSDMTVRFWDTLNGQQTSTIEAHDAFSSIAISPNGKVLVSRSGNIMRVWDAEAGRQKSVLEGHTGPITRVALSYDGMTIVSGSEDRTARVWDAETGLQKEKLEDPNGMVLSVAISSDGKTVAFGSSDRTVRVCDTANERKGVLKGHTSWVSSVAVSPDGKTIVSGSNDKTVRVWDAETGLQKNVLEGHTGDIYCVAISANGKIIVSGSSDNTVRVWNACKDQQESLQSGHCDIIRGVAISLDGMTVVSGSHDKTVRVWDTLTGLQKSVLERHTSKVTSVAISSDGETIVSASDDGNVRFWNASNGQQMRIYKAHNKVSSIAMSPDGKTFVYSSGMLAFSDRTVRVCDAETGLQKRVLKGQPSFALSVGISTDSRTVVSCSEDSLRTVRIWGLDDGQVKEVLTDTAGLKHRYALANNRVWPDVEPWFPWPTGEREQVIEFRSYDSDQVAFVIYVALPFYLSNDTLKITARNKRFLAFAKDYQLICYELI